MIFVRVRSISFFWLDLSLSAATSKLDCNFEEQSTLATKPVLKARRCRRAEHSARRSVVCCNQKLFVDELRCKTRLGYERKCDYYIHPESSKTQKMCWSISCHQYAKMQKEKQSP